MAAADRVVLPGQGAFADCAAGLDSVDGMRAAIDHAVAAGRPFLGICVGMQLMAERGLEHRITPGFGWVAGDVAAMDPPGLRLPQMGWNGLDFEPGAHKLLDGLVPGDHAYFVHSYALRGADPATVLATTDTAALSPPWWPRATGPAPNFTSRKAKRPGCAFSAISCVGCHDGSPSSHPDGRARRYAGRG